MNLKRICLFPFLLTVLLSGCGRDPDRISFPGLKFQLEVENKFFPRIADAHQFFFTEGWMEGQRIAFSPVARIRFFHLQPRDRQLHLEIKNPNPWLLKIRVFLNGAYIRQLSIEDLTRVKLTLPRDQLKIGENHLKLVTNVRDINEGVIRTDVKRKLYYMVNNIHFASPLTHKMGDRLNGSDRDVFLQPANSRLKIWVDPRKTGGLRYRFSVIGNRRGGRLAVSARLSDGTRHSLIEIPLKRKNHRGRISLEDLTGPALIAIRHHGQDRAAYLKWTRLQREDLAPAAVPAISSPLPTQQPPVFIILIDAARYDMINRLFDRQQTTPHIRDFSRQAVSFTRFYANAPYTIASVATLLSGLLPETHGVRKMEHRLPEAVTTLPGILSRAGYHSNALCANVTLFNTNLLRDFQNMVICRPFGEERIKNNSYVDIELLKKSIREADFSRPQFFYIHLLPPHEPYNPPEEPFYRFTPNTGYFPHTIRLIKKAERYNIFNPSFTENLHRMYLNNLLYADHLVGQILHSLKERQIYDQSLVIVTSDHGEAFFEHGKYTHNSTNYDEMIKVPFLLKLPGQQTPQTIETAHSLVDLPASLCRWLGIEGPPLPGPGIPISLDPDRPDPRPRVMYSRAVGKACNISLVEGPYKYIFFFGREELYHLSRDPAESRNLVRAEPFLALRLKQRLFDILGENLRLKERLGIKTVLRQQTDSSVLKELKALGYL